MTDEDYHQCCFCGEYVRNGYEFNGERHYLSDCRPDLVEHEIGKDCTWRYKAPGVAESQGLTPLPLEVTCYAFQDDNQKWTKEHIHFYPDGPM